MSIDFNNILTTYDISTFLPLEKTVNNMLRLAYT